ncbi:MAG: ABC transporter permease subunit [Acidimicrobiales bacterium]|nr:ABC transporter permease subunit [Acidimicrobiales bacterium]
MNEIRAEKSARRFARYTGRAFWVRTLAVAVFDAFAVSASLTFMSNGAWSVVALMAFALALVNWAYLSPRARASRWLTPGLVLMAFFVVYPVLYTAYVSFTNWQTGNILTKDQAIERLLEKEIRVAESGESGDLFVYENAQGALALLVVGESVEPFAGVPRPRGQAGEPVPAFEVPAGFDTEAPAETIGNYNLLTRLALTRVANQLENSEVDLPGGNIARVETLSSYRLVVSGARFSYDAGTDVLRDLQYDRDCSPFEGNFYCDGVGEEEVSRVALLANDSRIVCADGVCDNVPLYALDATFTGWRTVIGFDNYVDLIKEERIRTPFLRVFAWNVFFAFASVIMTFALGLGLAMLVKNEAMKGRNIYRSIYIIPYAVPGFLSILVWRGLLNTQYGKVNGLLETFGIPGVNWLGGTNQAMAAVLLVNLWLGFPYMFLISSGALTSIPEELIEAAKVDGAGPWKIFRSITLPLLLVSTAPLLIGSFAFNFNNFILIFLLTGGGPPLVGYDVPVGATDLLISFTFNLAQGSGRGQQFGLSTAIIVLIFLALATTSAMSFRLTKKLEEIYAN